MSRACWHCGGLEECETARSLREQRACDGEPSPRIGGPSASAPDCYWCERWGAAIPGSRSYGPDLPGDGIYFHETPRGFTGEYPCERLNTPEQLAEFRRMRRGSLRGRPAPFVGRES